MESTDCVSLKQPVFVRFLACPPDPGSLDGGSCVPLPPSLLLLFSELVGRGDAGEGPGFCIAIQGFCFFCGGSAVVSSCFHFDAPREEKDGLVVMNVHRGTGRVSQRVKV